MSNQATFLSEIIPPFDAVNSGISCSVIKHETLRTRQMLKGMSDTA
jgi:hypothetical protein